MRARLSRGGTLTAKIATGLFLASALLTASSFIAPQRGGGRGGGGRRGTVPVYDNNWVYDGRFVFCRLAFRQAADGDGGGWSVDYPRADLNFPFRLGELTETSISRDDRGEPNHVVLTAMDPHLFECPFVMMTEPGGAYFDEAEAANLRLYVEKGGFLWADDFWGEYAWEAWERQIRKAFPADAYPIVDIPSDHPLFHMLYYMDSLPQIPSLNHWLGSGYQTSERGADSAVPHPRGIQNANGDVMVLMTHNTDIGDSWEREGFDRGYFETFASKGYATGVNAFLYAVTH
jgi:hypothetical protein